MRIPPNSHWPVGFTTDFVSVFPDRPSLWAPGPWPWQWLRFRSVDLRIPSWWHDCRYYLGYYVAHTVAWDSLSMLYPIPNQARVEDTRLMIDQAFGWDCQRMGMNKITADAAVRLLKAFGPKHFYWAHGRRWARMARPWERKV